jgi:GxxExxY protein
LRTCNKDFTTEVTEEHGGKGVQFARFHPIFFSKRRFMPIAATVRRPTTAITGEIITCGMRVHSALGPGLLESTYQACFAYELRKAGLQVEVEVALPVVYDDVKLEIGYRIDLLVDNRVIIEVKSVDVLAPIHEAQLLSYMKLSGKSIGLLMNFNVLHLKDGIKRLVLGSNWN